MTAQFAGIYEKHSTCMQFSGTRCMVTATSNSSNIMITGSFHVISTQKKPDPLRFLRKLVTIRCLVSDDATPILGSPDQVFLDLWPFLCKFGSLIPSNDRDSPMLPLSHP